MRQFNALSFVVVLALVFSSACGGSHPSPTEPSTTPTGPAPEVVNPNPSAPTEFYDSAAGYVWVDDAKGIPRKVDVPAGMYRVIPLKFDPARHNPMPTAPEATITYMAMVCLSQDIPVDSGIMSFNVVASGYNGNSYAATISSWSSGDMQPGQCKTSTTMTRTTPGGSVGVMKNILSLTRRSSNGSIGGQTVDGIAPVLVPVDWGPR